MIINLTTFKKNPEKYFIIAKSEDVIVTRYSTRLGRLINEELFMLHKKRNAILALLGTANFPTEYRDP